MHKRRELPNIFVITQLCFSSIKALRQDGLRFFFMKQLEFRYLFTIILLLWGFMVSLFFNMWWSFLWKKVVSYPFLWVLYFVSFARWNGFWSIKWSLNPFLKFPTTKLATSLNHVLVTFFFFIDVEYFRRQSRIFCGAVWPDLLIYPTIMFV